jgi:4a-hydroxytetrahydrobiopterin dehydratase
MPLTRLSADEFAALDGLDDWRYVLHTIHAAFRAPSYPAAAALAGEVVRTAGAERLPLLDLRPPDQLRVVLGGGDVDGVTEADVELARRISELAAAAGAAAVPTVAQTTEIAIDALDIPAVRPFWLAVLGYEEVAGAALDPDRRGPAVWFQQMDAPRPQRNRIHLDVVVAHDVAEQRIAAAIAAGGRLVSDAEARAFWVLADPEGNEACVCTWQDRSR